MSKLDWSTKVNLSPLTIGGYKDYAKGICITSTSYRLRKCLDSLVHLIACTRAIPGEITWSKIFLLVQGGTNNPFHLSKEE